MLIEKSGLDILDEIDSSSPTPGGGSISALVGTLGICLARMYAHLSVNKKRFLELDETMQDEFKKSFHELKEYKNHLVYCMDDDCDAYDTLMRAYKLPKSSNEEIEARNLAIQKATLIAIESPYNIMTQALDAMKLCEKIVENGNKNAISDLACGIIFLDAAIQGAGLNVLINLSSLDENAKEEWTHKMNQLLQESHQLKTQTIHRIKKIM